VVGRLDVLDVMVQEKLYGRLTCLRMLMLDLIGMMVVYWPCSSGYVYGCDCIGIGSRPWLS
jgi:hypothetical protein